MQLCLNMIVRNEADKIERCIKSVMPYISCAAIVDTGSADGTVAKIEEIFKGAGRELRITTRDFNNFEYARNEALDFARNGDLAYDYLLLVDADMELKVDDPSCFIGLHGIAYDIEQRSGPLSYLNRRLLSRMADARYMGVTHEYLDVASAGTLKGVYFHDHADGTNRKEKYARDARLLLEALEKEPQNGRYWYYLGQSYRDWGKPQEAADAYQRALKYSTWDEERWSAQCNFACCLKDLKRDGDFLRETLKAYEMRPQRAETLYDIASYFRHKGENHSSLVFSKAGMEIPRPNDTLFVNDRVYKVGLKEEYSIGAYYDPRERAKGYEVCNELALSKDEHARHLARHNMYWYALPLAEFAPSFTPQRIEFTPPEGYTAMNPSVTEHSGELWMNIRTVNYRINEHGQYIIRASDGTANNTNPIHTRNFLTRLHSSSLLVKEASEVEIAPYEPKFPLVIGFEDMRLFSYKGELWSSSCVRDMNDQGICEQVLGRFDDNTISYVKRMLREPRLYEKNWMPVHEKKAFVYRLGQVVTPDGDYLHKNDPPYEVGHISGGSQVIPFYSGYLAMTHEANALPNEHYKRYYLHRFVYFDKDLNVQSISKPFYLHGKQIEFVAGMAQRKGDLVISYGVKDAEAWLGVVSKADVAAMVGAR